MSAAESGGARRVLLQRSVFPQRMIPNFLLILTPRRNTSTEHASNAEANAKNVQPTIAGYARPAEVAIASHSMFLTTRYLSPNQESTANETRNTVTKALIIFGFVPPAKLSLKF